MACGGCNQRREQLGVAARAILSGDMSTATEKVAEAAQSFRSDASALARTAGQRLAAAHARLKRR